MTVSLIYFGEYPTVLLLFHKALKIYMPEIVIPVFEPVNV